MSLLISIEIAVIIVLVLTNGLFAMSEIAVVSARKTRLEHLANRGDRRARAALEMAMSPARFLSTVQIWITLIGILAGAFGGATLASSLADFLRGSGVPAAYSDAIALGAVVLAITYVTLVLGELVPKRLALAGAERIAVNIAGPMNVLSRFAAPLVHILSVSTEAVVRLLGAKESQEPPVTEEEIKLLIEQGLAFGVFEEAERDMAVRVFRLGDRRIGDLITPRLETVWMDVGDSAEQIRQKVATSVHSRFPVAEGTLDNVLGVVQAKDLLARSLAGEPLHLRTSLQQPLYFPETMPALKALEQFRRSRVHIGIVVDEHGAFQGVVTLNDILGAIVGDIPTPEEEDMIVKRDDGSWLVDGLLPVDELKQLLDIPALPHEDENSFSTAAGFVMAQLDRVPAVADHFTVAGFRFEVVDMDGRRVDRILIKSVESSST